VHTIVVLIVNAFSPAAGVRVEGDGYWRWCVLKRVVVVLKPKIKRSGGLEVAVALGQARFDSAVSLRRWSGVVEWCDAVRCGYASSTDKCKCCAALRKRARGLQGPTRQA